MAVAVSISPAKITTTKPIIITQFPDNPKPLILEQCKTVRDLNQIHAHLIKTRFISSPSVAENFLESAAILLRHQPMDYAISVFEKLNEPNSSAYNIMIRGLTLKNFSHEAILMFKKMKETSVEPDEFTFPCVLKACSRLRALEEGKQIHGQLMKLGCRSSGFAENGLIKMYANCGQAGIARKVFDEMYERDIFAWNALFSGYTKSGCWKEAIDLFHYMLETDMKFDEVTLVSVLTACGRVGALKLGEWIDEYIEANGLKGNPTLITALVDMYAKCGDVDKARSLFNQMPHRDVVAWSAMISGYNQASRCKEALSLFHDMQKANIEPNEVTMVSVLSSCAELGALATGKWVHFYINKKKLPLTVTLGTALLLFYAKCGSIDNSIEVFKKMPRKNVLSWSVLIQGLASNGQGDIALKYFDLMLTKHIQPNDITFIGVLSACSHSGLVDKGRELFASMIKDFDIEPKIEHYGCMVDLLSRAGFLDEAHELVESMPMEPNDAIWGALLGGCRIHKNVELACKIGQKIGNLNLEDDKAVAYLVLLSNVYAGAKRWKDVANVREYMVKMALKKPPGRSWIQIGGSVHEFLAGDRSHKHKHDVSLIYEMLLLVTVEAGLTGYTPDVYDAAQSYVAQ